MQGTLAQTAPARFGGRAGANLRRPTAARHPPAPVARARLYRAALPQELTPLICTTSSAPCRTSGHLPAPTQPRQGQQQPPTPCTMLSTSGCLAAVPLAMLLLMPPSADAASLSDLTNSAVDLVAVSGWLGPAVFVAVYVISTVLLVPASVLTLAAGALFGPVAGTALVSLASTAGATAAFLVSRYLARPLVEKRLEGVPSAKAVLTGVAAGGPWVIFLLRLSPLVPFNLLNYTLGLTPVGLLPYVGASWVGMLPGTFAYVYLGGAGKAAVDAASGGMDAKTIVLYGVGAVATVLATRAISKAAGKALEEQQGGMD